MHKINILCTLFELFNALTYVVECSLINRENAMLDYVT